MCVAKIQRFCGILKRHATALHGKETSSLHIHRARRGRTSTWTDCCWYQHPLQRGDGNGDVLLNCEFLMWISLSPSHVIPLLPIAAISNRPRFPIDGKRCCQKSMNSDTKVASQHFYSHRKMIHACASLRKYKILRQRFTIALCHFEEVQECPNEYGASGHCGGSCSCYTSRKRAAAWTSNVANIVDHTDAPVTLSSALPLEFRRSITRMINKIDHICRSRYELDLMEAFALVLFVVYTFFQKNV